MTDYLSNLVARQLGQAESVHPRLASRFEPPTAASLPPLMQSDGALIEEDPSALQTEQQFELELQELLETSNEASTGKLRLPQRVTATALTEPVDIPPSGPKPSSLDAETRERPNAESKETSTDGPAAVVPVHVLPSLMQGDEPAAPPAQTDSSDKTSYKPAQEATEQESEHQSDQGMRPLLVRTLPRNFSDQPVNHPSAIHPVSAEARPSSTAHEERRGERSKPSVMPSSQGAPLLIDEQARDQSVQASASPSHSPNRTLMAPQPNPGAVTPREGLRPLQSRANVIAEPRVAQSTESKVSAEPAPDRTAETAPVINITIGRVEVRASKAPAPSQRSNSSSPHMKLDDYLRRRAGGGGL